MTSLALSFQVCYKHSTQQIRKWQVINKQLLHIEQLKLIHNRKNNTKQL